MLREDDIRRRFGPKSALLVVMRDIAAKIDMMSSDCTSYAAIDLQAIATGTGNVIVENPDLTGVADRDPVYVLVEAGVDIPIVMDDVVVDQHVMHLVGCP